MSFDFEKLKLVSQKTTYLFFGFMHEIEKQFSMTIPDLITFISIFYYYQFEYFTIGGQCLDINDDKTIVTYNSYHITSPLNSVYGNIKIDVTQSMMTYIWTFKILNIGCVAEMVIGIDNSDQKWIGDDFGANDWNKSRTDYTFYAFSTDNAIYTNDNLERSFEVEILDKGIEKNDMIRMELNAKERTLQYYKNDKIIECCIYNLMDDGAYHLAISMHKGTSVQLIILKYLQNNYIGN